MHENWNPGSSTAANGPVVLAYRHSEVAALVVPGIDIVPSHYAAWMSEIGLRHAKDSITIEQFYKGQIALEETNLTVRRPADEFARKILP
jgi:hypothetical protein